MVPVKQAHRYLLSFGSNLGNRQQNCEQGLQLLSQYVQDQRCSRWISTAPLTSSEYDTTDHQYYLNFVVVGSSSLNPPDLYDVIAAIEDRVGHSRVEKWLPRNLDIDILFYAKDDHQDFIACSPLKYYSKYNSLEVPHQGFWQRGFLQELVEQDLGIPLPKLKARHQRPIHEHS